LLAAITILLLSSCSVSRTGPEADTLRWNLGSEPPSLDWQTSTDSVSFDVVSNIMVGLTQYTPDLQCAPACAKSWEVLDGGKRYVFHLRDDVKWTDGKRLVAGDFEYAWKRLLNPATAAQYAFFLYDIENAFEYNTGKIKDANLIGAQAIDDTTLEVKLKKPAAYFIFLTAFCPSYPQRKDVVERWGDRWTEPDHIVTNGPFYLKEWQHEYKITLAANANFFEGPPKLKQMKLFMVPEQATAFALYENNEIDYVDNRSFSTPDVERYRNSPEYQNIPLLRNNYVAFNVTKHPFTDARIRRAFSMGMDRTVFPRILRRGERPSYSWLPPGLAGYSPESGMQFNPQEARRLLSEAGYPNGKGFPRAGLLYPNREDTRLIVEAIQDQLKRNLNVHVDLVNNEWKVYLETLHRDPPPIFRASWGADYPDPETFMNLFTSHNGNNNTRWKNPAYDHLIEQAEGEQDPAKRANLYQQADTMLCKEQAIIAPTFLATQNVMVKPWVHGMKFNALDLAFFKNVWVDQPAGQ
jgi:oligopeptide transport system substrate-binding protein